MPEEELVERSQEIKGCVECGHPIVVKGYPTSLCSDCRTGFINYPIPRWIMLFAAGIGIVALFSMYKLPHNFKAARHLEKAKTAIENKQYLTAEKELLLAAKRYPDNEEINAYMVVASFYNDDLFSMNQYLQKLQKSSAVDQELVSMVNAVSSEADYYFPNEALIAVINRYDSSIANVPADSLLSYINHYPNDVYAKNVYAAIFYEKEQYNATDSLLQEVIKLHPDNVTALGFLASVKRQLNQQDASIKYCDQMLHINAENTFAMGSKARTLPPWVIAAAWSPDQQQ
jgi:hypothetical protein